MSFEGYLKADTQTNVTIGPVVSISDGYTPVTNLSVSTADEAEIIKHNATSVTDISGNTMTAITNADGYYYLTITAGQLDTEGRITVLINDDSLCLPVRADFEVVNANVYDSLFAVATTDYLQVDTLQVEGSDATDQINAACDTAFTDYDPPTKAEMDAAFTEIKGATWSSGTDTLEHIRDKETDIETDTQDLQTQIGTDGAGLTDLGGMSSGMKAEVNAEVLDVLNTDTFAEPGQEAPPATTTLIKKLGYLYKFLRNKIDNDGSTIQVYADDASTVDQKSTVSETAGTVTRGEFGSGP